MENTLSKNEFLVMRCLWASENGLSKGQINELLKGTISTNTLQKCLHNLLDKSYISAIRKNKNNIYFYELTEEEYYFATSNTESIRSIVSNFIEISQDKENLQKLYLIIQNKLDGIKKK